VGVWNGFGTALDVTGKSLLIGAPKEPRADGTETGMALLYLVPNHIVAHQFLPISQDPGQQFGAAVCFHKGNIVIGAPTAIAGGQAARLAYVFDAAGNLLTTLGSNSPVKRGENLVALLRR
jgi:hypothetical protein